MLIDQWIHKKQKRTKTQKPANDYLSSGSNHYHLGLSSEGFHRLYYREWGERNSEQTILCVHGLTRISQDFDTLAKKLSQKYRVICPDIVGRGNSDWFGNKQNYNITQYCADINALIAHLHVDKIHFIGTSMGGIIGMILAGMAHTPIQSMILNDVGPFIRRRELQTMGEYVGRAPTFSSLEELYDYYRKIYQGSCALLSNKEIEMMAQYSSFKTEGGYRLHYDPKIGDAFRKHYTSFNFELWKYWEEIECPMLVLRGSESNFLTSDVAEKMCATAEETELVEIEGAGHTPLLKTTHEIKVIEKFLTKVIKTSSV